MRPGGEMGILGDIYPVLGAGCCFCLFFFISLSGLMSVISYRAILDESHNCEGEPPEFT